MKYYEYIASQCARSHHLRHLHHDGAHADQVFKDLNDWVTEHLVSGSGFDRGTWLVGYNAETERITLRTAYHHMEHGTYTCWTDHEVIVTPSFIGGIKLRITGRDYRDVKDHIAQVFYEVLGREFR